MKSFNLYHSGICFIMAVLSVIKPLKAQVKETAKSRPNIIFILSDDHAYQTISAYGSKLAQTPNIDRIAAEGAIFKNAVVTNAICGPSRATFITGKYSHKNGYKYNEQKFNTNQQLFSSLLQQGGYQTAWLGKWHLGNLPKGFDYYNILPGQGQYFNPDFINSSNDTVRINGYVTNIITGLATDWIDKRDTAKPFFLVVGEKATHREWQPDIQDFGAYDQVKFPLPSTFYDNYDNRLAAKDQDMTIDKTMRLKEDLKVHVNYSYSREQTDSLKKEMLRTYSNGRKPGPEDEKRIEYYLRNNMYSRLDPEQKKAYSDYYENKVSREFDQLKLQGKALTEWKYQRYLKDYLSTANSLDRNIGKILDYLDQKGLAENTVVIYASDNGFFMGEHGWFDKRFMYQEALHVPLVIRYPKVIRPGTKSDKFVLNNDWAPTVLDIAGIKTPPDMQGTSFLPLVKSGTSPTSWRNEVYYHYYEFPQPHHVYPHFGITTDQYKLIRFYGPSDSWELFDLKKDPQELHNLYGSAAYKEISDRLKQTLKAQIIKYDDTEALKILQ